MTTQNSANSNACVKANNLSDVSSASTSRTNLGLGTIATQAASAVAVTGGTVDGTTLGTTTPAAAQVYQNINTQTGTTYTHVLSDTDKLVTLNNASAITFTIDTNANVATPIGSKIDLLQLGAGQVTVAAAGGVTLTSYTSKVKLAGQYAAGSIVKTGTNAWTLVGNIA